MALHNLDVSKIGFRVVTDIPRPSLQLVDAYAQCPTPDIADVVTKMFSVSSVIKPLYTPITRIAGTALTVRVPPGDNLMVHAAVTYAREGDVIVVDARGDEEYALGGALLAAIAQTKGVRGFVLDGVYRDVDELRKINFPVFARGRQPKACSKHGPGEINTVVQCGGVPVHPGDIVVADEDGVVVVPAAYAEAVLAKAQGREEWGREKWADVGKWREDHHEIFTKRLRDMGVPIH